jgi:hypothetical protein
MRTSGAIWMHPLLARLLLIEISFINGHIKPSLQVAAQGYGNFQASFITRVGEIFQAGNSGTLAAVFIRSQNPL